MSVNLENEVDVWLTCTLHDHCQIWCA